jgi:phenylacetate-coenzyme A ligase PaaK-like adenylate-forming protein
MARHEGRRVTIGHLPWESVHSQAKTLACLGGAPVADSAGALSELAVTGPAEIFAVSRRLTASGGSAVMSSGGTTGRPKLTFVAHDQGIGRLFAQWRPLAPGDVLLNVFTPGRLWASHYYMQTLAERSCCHVVPAGPFGADEVGTWLGIFQEIGVNAVAGTPTALADLAAGVRNSGDDLGIRKVIWMAEPWSAAKVRAVRMAFPHADFWGNYGSVETFVIATNDPSCDMSVLHLMPDQLLELDDRGALLTRAGSGWTVPTVRYRLGDRLAAADCGCGRPGGLRVVGRADDAIKLYGSLFGIGEILQGVREHTGVTDAQLVLTRGPDASSAVSQMDVHFTGAADPADVRRQLLGAWVDLPVIAAHYPDALLVSRVERLERITRTNKVPPMIWREARPREDMPGNQ